MLAKNVGTIDRFLRVIAGIAILSLFFLYPEAGWRYYALIGIVPLVTGALGTCPLYSLVGISTCPAKRV
jgi:hypothetical protein